MIQVKLKLNVNTADQGAKTVVQAELKGNNKKNLQHFSKAYCSASMHTTIMVCNHNKNCNPKW